MAQELPTRIARQDEELQTRIHKDSLSLAKLRHRWVKEEGVSGVSYAKSVVNIHTGNPLHPSVINHSVKAYSMWTDPNQEFDSWADCEASARMSEERREIAKVVVASTPGVSMSTLRTNGRPASAAARKVIRDIQATVAEAKAEGREIDPKEEAERVVGRRKLNDIIRNNNGGNEPKLVHLLDVQNMRTNLIKYARAWEGESISKNLRGTLIDSLDELSEAVAMVRDSVASNSQTDWDTELAKLVG